MQRRFRAPTYMAGLSLNLIEASKWIVRGILPPHMFSEDIANVD